MIGKKKNAKGSKAAAADMDGACLDELYEAEHGLDEADDDYDADELDELMERYIWDEEAGVLYEVANPERRERSFPHYAALGLAGLLLCAAVLFSALSGASFLPEECYGGESVLSENEAMPDDAHGTNAAPQQSAEHGTNAEETSTGDDAQYVPAAIVIDGRERATLASAEAAHALIEDVKNYFDGLVSGDGERTVELADEIEVVPRPAAQPEDIQSYDELFADFTSKNTPIKVKTTLVVAETGAVGFEQDTEKDKYLVEGTRIIVTAGREGSQTEITRNVYINGERSSSRSGSETQVVKAQDMLVRVGSQKLTDDDSPGRHEGREGRDAGERTFISPCTGDIACNFGQRSGVLHLGLDYEAEDAPNVVASCAGRVVCAMERGGYGLMLEIDHGDGFVTRYAHLSELAVGLGDDVEQGDIVAVAGSSGSAEATILHFELRIDGEAYNPRYYLE